MFHLAVALALVWLSQSVATNSDVAGYLLGVRLLRDGASSFFPPATSALIGLTSLLPGGDLAGKVTLVQSALILWAGLWAFRLVRIHLPVSSALPITLLTFSMPVILTMPRAFLSEALGFFSIVGAIYFFVLAMERGSTRAAIASGMMLGVVAVSRVVPLAGILPGLLWVLVFRPATRWRLLTVAFALAAAGTVAVPMTWTAVHGNGFALTYSAPAHLYNRVVYEQHLIDSSATASRILLAKLHGVEPWSDQHSIIEHRLIDEGMDYRESIRLLGRVAREGIRRDPVAYATGSLRYQAQLLFLNGVFDPFAIDPTVVDSVERPPIFGISASALDWRRSLERAQGRAWPLLAWVSLLVLPILATLGRRAAVLFALGASSLLHMTGIAFTENVVDRYMVLIQPFLVVVALAGTVVVVLERVRAVARADWRVRSWNGAAHGVPASGAVPSTRTPEAFMEFVVQWFPELALVFLACAQGLWFLLAAPLGISQVLGAALGWTSMAAAVALTGSVVVRWRVLFALTGAIVMNLLVFVGVSDGPLPLRPLLLVVLMAYVVVVVDMLTLALTGFRRAGANRAIVELLACSWWPS